MQMHEWKWNLPYFSSDVPEKQHFHVFIYFSMTHSLVWPILPHLHFLSCQMTFVSHLKDVELHEQIFETEKYPDQDLQSRHHKAHMKNVIG